MLPNSSHSDSENEQQGHLSSTTFATVNQCYPVNMGKDKLATRKSVLGSTNEVIERNAYTLTGDTASDSDMLDAIENQSCDGLIPVVVIKMSPNDGNLQLGENMKKVLFYQPESKFSSWKDYDKVLNKVLKRLSKISSIVILEPNLLMSTYEASFLQYRWSNEKYEENFLQRALKVAR